MDEHPENFGLPADNDCETHDSPEAATSETAEASHADTAA